MREIGQVGIVVAERKCTGCVKVREVMLKEVWQKKLALET
jgi:hypothetical protein